MSATNLLIARHGTIFRPQDKVVYIGGKTDLPLVEEGRVQARQLGEYLKERGLFPDHIFTSQLKRCVQTAQQMRKAVKVKTPITKKAVFNEIDYGPDENKSIDDIRQRLDNNALQAWDQEGIPSFGWEVDSIDLRAEWHDFGQRLLREFPDKTVLVITDDGVARFASVLTGDTYGLQARDGISLNPGCFGHLVYEGPNWRCVGWNKAALVGPVEKPNDPEPMEINTSP